MDATLKSEFERLTRNATIRREDLFRSAQKKARRRKMLNVLAGILSLTSAAAITAVINKYFTSDGVQIIAAIIAAVSGIISLLLTTYFDDGEIFNMRLAA